MNIQILQGMVHAGELRLDSGKGNIAESSPSVSNVMLPGIKNTTLPGFSNVPKQQIDLTEFSYPPFFPLGDTQGIYTVLSRPKSDSSSSDYLETQRAALEEHHTVNTKRVTEQKQQKTIVQKNSSTGNTVPDVTRSVSPGSFLNVKI
jgi:hypothetical protein